MTRLAGVSVIWLVGCSNKMRSTSHAQTNWLRTQSFSSPTMQPSWSARLLSFIPSIVFLSCLSCRPSSIEFAIGFYLSEILEKKPSSVGFSGSLVTFPAQVV